jgi:DNA-binding transcriptional regulator YiaG
MLGGDIMRQDTCPLCGSKNLEKSEKQSSGKITLGESFSFKEVYSKCFHCHEEFDLSYETDRNYKNAEKKAQKKFAENAIKELSEQNITMSFFERVFELPIRTLSRWKSGDFSFASLALLRIVETYPWIVEVAEHGFEESFSKMILTQIVDDDIIADDNIPEFGTKDSSNMSYDSSFEQKLKLCGG